MDRRPEKSAESWEFGEGRGHRDEKLGFWVTGQGPVVVFAALRGEGQGLVRENLFDDQY